MFCAMDIAFKLPMDNGHFSADKSWRGQKTFLWYEFLMNIVPTNLRPFWLHEIYSETVVLMFVSCINQSLSGKKKSLFWIREWKYLRVPEFPKVVIIPKAYDKQK